MPPVRRARHADPTGTPYPDGWLSYRRRLRRPVGGIVRGDESGDVSSGGAPPSLTTLPDDVLFGIFSRVSGFTDAARCAATCRRWARVVATRAASISRALPPPPPPPGGFLPHLAIGVFLQHQENRRCVRGGGGAAAQLRFVPTAFAASRTLAQYAAAGGGSGAHLVGEGGATFDDARPVASRNGRVVLHLQREERGDGLTLCVWNPMTGDVAIVPTLSGEEFPGDAYACAILTGDDLNDDDDCSPGFFRLLLVYGRRGFTALRSFSSDTGRWGVECKKPGAKIGGDMLRQLGPAVVLHGVAYWPMHRAALGVPLSGTAADTMDVCSVPYKGVVSNCKLDEHVLGVSPDGRPSFVNIGIVGALGMPLISFSKSLLDDEDIIRIDLPQIKVTRTTPMKPWWFGEKSGTLIFTVGEEKSSTCTVFALNVVTRSLEKLANGVTDHTCCRRIYGYEMDRAALLASVAPQ